MRRIVRGLRAALLALAALALAAAAQAQRVDATQILADVKAATGGRAWDAFTSQHSRVRMTIGPLSGSAERWASLLTGRSLLRYELGALRGAQGFDGISAWAQETGGDVAIAGDDNARELAANVAYRDRLAFWYPDRQRARIEYARSDAAGGVDYDVVRITPEGGRPYEVWVNMLTRRIERLVEREGDHVRTEAYADFRSVQGVTLPFRVRTTRGDPRYDEEYTVESIAYNVRLDDIDFSVPAPRERTPPR